MARLWLIFSAKQSRDLIIKIRQKRLSLVFSCKQNTYSFIQHFKAQWLWSSKILGAWNLIEQIRVFNYEHEGYSICFLVAILILISKLLQVAKLRMKSHDIDK